MIKKIVLMSPRAQIIAPDPKLVSDYDEHLVFYNELRGGKMIRTTIPWTNIAFIEEETSG